MRAIIVSVFAITVIGFTPDTAFGESKCSAPPYGGEMTHYNAFIKDFGHIFDDPNQILKAVCRVKFEGADRTAFYKLGFTDQDIDSQETSDLAAKLVIAMKRVVGGP